MSTLPSLSPIVYNEMCNFNTSIPDKTLDVSTYSNCKEHGLNYVTWNEIPINDINSNNIAMFLSVFKNNLSNFYIELVHDVTNGNIYMIVTDTYKYNMSWCSQDYSAQLSASLENITDLTDAYFSVDNQLGVIYNYNNMYSCPVAKIKLETNNSKLYCNYENNNINISVVDISDVTRHTYNMFCGLIKKHRPWDKGWFFGGSSCGVVHTINRISVEKNSIVDSLGNTKYYGTLSFIGTDTIYENDPSHNNFDYYVRKYKYTPTRDYRPFIIAPILDGSYYMYNTSKPNIRFNNNFDVFVRVEVDDSLDNNRYWASNIANNNFTKMYCSYSQDDIELPTYKNIISKSLLDTGGNLNTLNNISTVMPIYFMVLRDPAILDSYSSIGYTDFINYISMYNIASGSINNVSFPITMPKKYQCFSLYKRRMSNQYVNKNWYETYKDGFYGYAGIAVSMGTAETIISDWYYMLSINTDNAPIRTINNINTGIKAYAGITNYVSPYKNGVMYLKMQYNYFDKIKIKYTDLGGTFNKEVVWDSLSLKEKLEGTLNFDLLNNTDPLYHWMITPDKQGLDQQIAWYSTDSNCGIIDILGI